MLTVLQQELIRRKVLVDGLSQRGVARELGHSRKTVKKAVSPLEPPRSRQRVARKRPVLEPVSGIIDAWLEADRTRPRKQRHTAMRVFERLRDEHQFAGSYSPVQRFVAEWKQRQGRQHAEVFVPLVFAAGEEAQVDWGEATVLIGGRERTLQFFCLRLAYSRAVYVRAYERQDQVSFLDAHVRAFEFLGGIPKRLAYDNLKSAVVRVGRGRERDLSAKFVAMRSWYLFDTRFCNVARGNEKGHVENLVKRVQRTFLTPLPEVSCLAELNQRLERDCREELDRELPRAEPQKPEPQRPRTFRDLWDEERSQLLSLPMSAFRACEEEPTRVDKFLLVRFENCSYSVPVVRAYQPCVLRAYVDRVEIFCEHECVATHRRGTVAEQYVLEPRHYLPVLERKPGVLLNGRPFQGEPFGPDFALLRRELEYRYAADGTRQFIRVLLLLTTHPEADVRAAVARCVSVRAFQADAVEAALRNAPLDVPCARLDLRDRPELAHVGNGIRSLAEYDQVVAAQRESFADESSVDEMHVDEMHVECESAEDSQASRAALAPGQDLTAIDGRGADDSPLARNIAHMEDARMEDARMEGPRLLCGLEPRGSESLPERESVSLTRKDNADDDSEESGDTAVAQRTSQNSAAADHAA